MAKRKLGASIIILCIAAVTLVSGTYAWFQVGGFAELFDIGFDVIESGAGILVQGDTGTAEGGTKDWGSKVEKVDFARYSFIVENGRYKPISSSDVSTFIYVTMENDDFNCEGIVPTKVTPGVTDDQICMNDFTLYIKSNDQEIPAGAYMTVKLEGEAAAAARVAVAVDGSTTIYAVDGESYNAVTRTFGSGDIVDNNENYIIDSADEGYELASLQAVGCTSLVDGETEYKIPIGSIPGVGTQGKSIRVIIWLEGNDKDCIAVGEKSIAGKNLSAKIAFKSE